MENEFVNLSLTHNQTVTNTQTHFESQKWLQTCGDQVSIRADGPTSTVNLPTKTHTHTRSRNEEKMVFCRLSGHKYLSCN